MVDPRVQLAPGALPLSLSRLMRVTQVCKPWRRDLEARGFCGKTAQLCSLLAGGGNAARLRQNALRRLHASTGDDAERALCLDGGAFLEKSLELHAVEWEYRMERVPATSQVTLEEWLQAQPKGNLQDWLQAASQEPDASLLSRGAASTAQSLGLTLVQWVGKPQGRYPESYTLVSRTDFYPGQLDGVFSVALSRDGKRAATGSEYGVVKIWDADTGAEVSSLG